jgi:hypothetical protein
VLHAFGNFLPEAPKLPFFTLPILGWAAPWLLVPHSGCLFWASIP